MLSKKFFSGLLAVLLLVSNSGFAFSVHFCGGSLASISSSFSNTEVCKMEVKEDKACCAAKSSDEKPCCEDKTVDLKKSADTIVKVFSVNISSPFISAISTRSFEIPTFLKVATPTFIAYTTNDQARSLFQLYNQYLFYA